MELTTILLIVGAVLVVYAIWAYNHFVSLTQRAVEAWADIDVQLKRRYDLIPNLVESVKGYAAHEAGTLSAVTDARAKATQVHVDPANITPAQIEAMAAAEGALSASLGKLLAIAENYPDLKASANFVELQRELTDTENKIQAARRFYNGNVRDLSTSLQSFPGNVIGNTFGFKEREYFELGANEQAAKDPVKVSF
jgi:LemA protein